ncbi:MAG: hypothetical protein ABFD49_08880 [Armatimonadota bacterium]|nr:hypothetical protein [bacterium]
MKCPKCGTFNGKTNKFCRECGLHMAWVVEDDNQRQASTGPALDDVALGESLAEVYDCYESGDLDAALSGAENIAGRNPDSTSVHGILALIYERKGEIELESGETESAHGFLEMALAQYEKIIDLNPNSAADREKLSALRVKLNGGTAHVSIVRRPVAGLKHLVNSMPPQALAAGVVFIAVLMAAIILMPGGGRTKTPGQPRPDVEVQLQHAAPTDSEPRGVREAADVAKPAGLKVYTFSSPAAKPPAPKPVASGSSPRPVGETSEHHPEVKPVKLPSLGNELTIVPESKKSQKAGAKTESAQSKPASGQAKEDTTPKVDGTSLLAAAIRMRNQGQTREAIDSAQQAITHFQSEINAGTNPTSAMRGIDNAKKLIGLWQQSL